MLINWHRIIKFFKNIYRILLFAPILVLGCNELLPPDSERLGYDYFPLAASDYRLYQVQEINYNLDGSIDTINYQLREIITDESVKGDETSFRLDRYRRTIEADPWVIDSVWSARINTYQAIVVENNVPIIKLSFPVKEDKSWDGNAMNAREFDEFEMINVGLTYQIDDKEYPNSLEMLKEFFQDPAQITKDDIQLEVYSKDIGLIYSLDIYKIYCSPIDCSEPSIDEGKIVEQKLLEVGKI